MKGIPILGCLPNSPAGKAGLRYGDVLLAVNGHPVASIQDFLQRRSESGGAMDLLVKRGHQVIEVSIQLRKVEGLTAQQMLSDLAEIGTERLAHGPLHELAERPACLN